MVFNKSMAWYSLVTIICLLYSLKRCLGVNRVDFQAPRCCVAKCVSKKGTTFNGTYCKCQCIPYEEIPLSVKSIDLSHNNVTILTRNSFARFLQLESINLTDNNIQEINEFAFNGLSRSVLILRLSSNPITAFGENVFSDLHSLQDLWLDNISMTCSVFNTSIFSPKISISTLYIRKNNLNKFPKFVQGNRSLIPSVMSLYFNDNSLTDLKPEYFRGIESVEELFLSNNRIIVIQSECFKNLPNLRELVLTRNILSEISSTAFSGSSFHSLLLKEPRELKISKKNQMIFEKLPALRHLNLRNIQFDFKQTDLHRLFQAFENLTSLNIQGTKFRDSEMKYLKYLKSMIKLTLTDNNIKELDRNDFTSITKTLKELYLGSNRITSINITSLPDEMWDTLEVIELSDNPWTCDCGIIWIRDWFKKNKKKVVDIAMPSQYRCNYNSRSKPLLNLSLTQEECATTDPDFCLVSTFISVFVLYSITLVAAVSHRYRWHVRYWYFILKMNRNKYLEMMDQREYEYDAFISYCAKDFDWVSKNLPRLESEYNLRLCFHDRDWLVGRDIVENIITSIENSRKTVLIVSNAFAISQWCHFELAMVQTRLLELDRDNVVLVLLEEILDINMNPRLRLQMQRQTYVEWTDYNEAGQQLFWAKLSQALSKPSSSQMNSPILNLAQEMFPLQ